MRYIRKFNEGFVLDTLEEELDKAIESEDYERTELRDLMKELIKDNAEYKKKYSLDGSVRIKRFENFISEEINRKRFVTELNENNLNENLRKLFNKAKDFFLKTFQKGEYRYKGIDILLKSIDRNELHNEINLDKKFKELFDKYTVNNQTLNDILYPHKGRTERLKKLSDGQFENVMRNIKEVISIIESNSKFLKKLDTEKEESKKQEEKRKKQEGKRKRQEEERRNKHKKLLELWNGISKKVKYVNYYDTLKPFYSLLKISVGKGSGKESNISDDTEEILKKIYQFSNKNVNQEIDTSSILNEVNSLNKSFEDYVSLYKEIYNKTPDEKIKEKKETDDEINKILQTIKQYKTYKEMVLDVLNKKNRLVNHKGKIVYHGSKRRDLEKDKFNNTINTKKRTGYGLYTSPHLNTAVRYAFAYIFGHLSKGGVDLKPNYDGKANIYRIELGNMPFLLRLDPIIDKEEMEMLLAFGIGGYDGLFQDANEIEISIITSDNISKAERITNSNYPAEFKEIKEFGKKYMGKHGYGKSYIDKEKFITARLQERLKSY